MAKMFTEIDKLSGNKGCISALQMENALRMWGLDEFTAPSSPDAVRFLLRFFFAMM